MGGGRLSTGPWLYALLAREAGPGLEKESTGQAADPQHMNERGHSTWPSGASQVVLVVRNPPTNARDIRDTGSIPGLGGSPGEGHGSPLQYSCLENPMDRGYWRDTVHGVAKSGTTQATIHTLGTSGKSACQCRRFETQV